MKNLDTVYAYCMCISVIGFSPTQAEAQEEADKLEPMDVADSIQSGYVLEIKPGQIDDNIYQGSEGLNDYVVFEGQTYVRPQWMEMGAAPRLRQIATQKMVRKLEDAKDSRAAQQALKEVGTIPWEELKAELEL
ncbi:MAG: hypothetical protein WBB28_20740 [Crinalium sp.]